MNPSSSFNAKDGYFLTKQKRAIIDFSSYYPYSREEGNH